MANDKDQKNNSRQENSKPPRNANAQPMPEDFSNEANHKGAVDLGTDSTKATASQQQGQGAWNPKNNDDNRNGSRKDGADQGNKNKNGE